MITHYLKIAWRNLLKYKVQTVVTLVGWALGFTCLALSAYWLRYEHTFDTGHPEADRMYFLALQDTTGTYHETMRYEYCTDVPQRFPEVECATAIPYGYVQIQLNDSIVCPYNVIDPGFLDVFRLPLVAGTEEFLRNPSYVGLTESVARRLFGHSPAVGRELTIKEKQVRVGAVVADLKGHSVFDFGLLQCRERRKDKNYGELCLVRLGSKADPHALAGKITRAFKERTYSHLTFQLVPISQYRAAFHESIMPVRLIYLNLFVLISALIVLSILVNYYAFFSSRLQKRWREMAIRQVCGASPAQLFGLLMTEFLMLLAGGLLLGFILLELLLPAFREYAQIQTLEPGHLWMYILLPALAVWLGYVLLFVVFTRRTLQRNLQASRIGIGAKLNLTFQLTLTALVTFCVGIMAAQIHYLRSPQSQGFESKDRIIMGASWQDNWRETEAAIRKMAGVRQTLYGFHPFFTSYQKLPVTEWDEKKENGDFILIDFLWGDQAWMDFWGIRLLEGHVPSASEAEEGLVLINEAARQAFGWHEAVGKQFVFEQYQFRVAGVIGDFSHRVLEPEAPLMILRPGYSAFARQEKLHQGWCFRVQVKTEDGAADEVCQRILSQHPELEAVKASDLVDGELRSELLLLRLLWVAAALCVGVAVFCVYSMVTLACEQRRKEIALRKINGATTGDIYRMWCREYMTLWLLSLLVAFPAGYILMRRWLERYVHQISIGAGYYVAVALVLGLLMLLGMGTQVWKASRRQPADDIRIDS